MSETTANTKVTDFLQIASSSGRSSAVSQKRIVHTSIDPVTDRYYKDESKRLQFNRKLERNVLPLLIVKYDGIIGSLIREDLIYNNTSFNVRPNIN